MSTFVPGYMDFLNQMEEVDAFVSQSREKREDRIEIYDNIAYNHLPQLGKFVMSINRAEGHMDDELKQEARKVRKESIRFQVTLWVAVILGVLNIYLSYLLYVKDHSVAVNPPKIVAPTATPQ